jgi:hypothetical protein
MIVISMQGGLINGVASDEPALIGKAAIIIDYDIEGTDASDEVRPIPQGDGTTEEAAVSHQEIGTLFKPVADFLRANEGDVHDGNADR